MNERELETNYETNEISLKDLFKVIWSKKFLILVVGFIGLVLGGLGGLWYQNQNQTVVSIVNFQWEGLSDGVYPDGSEFDYSNAIEPYVISAAIQEVGLDITSSEVREATTITPLVPSDVSTLILSALEKGEQLTYFSSDYKISIDISKLKITEEESKSLINSVLIGFEEDFDKKYISHQVILDYTGTDFLNIDYVDIEDILSTQTSLIVSVMSQKYNENPDFVSPTLSVGFNDLLVRSELVRRVEISQIEAKTNAYLLTKDSDYIITKYNYEIEKLDYDLQELQLREAGIQDQITNYNAGVSTVIIPGLDNEIPMDNAYSDLVDEILSVQQQIADVTYDKQYLEDLVAKYEDPTLIVSANKQAEEIANVEALILDVDEKLADMVEDANVLLTEYNTYMTSTLVQPLMAPEIQFEGSMLMFAGIGLLVFAGVSVAVVLFKHDWN